MIPDGSPKAQSNLCYCLSRIGRRAIVVVLLQVLARRKEEMKSCSGKASSLAAARATPLRASHFYAARQAEKLDPASCIFLDFRCSTTSRLHATATFPLHLADSFAINSVILDLLHSTHSSAESRVRIISSSAAPPNPSIRPLNFVPMAVCLILADDLMKAY